MSVIKQFREAEAAVRGEKVDEWGEMLQGVNEEDPKGRGTGAKSKAKKRNKADEGVDGADGDDGAQKVEEEEGKAPKKRKTRSTKATVSGRGASTDTA